MDLQRIQLLLGKNKRIVSQIIQRIHNMYLLTEWQGRTGNIWLKVMAYFLFIHRRWMLSGPETARLLDQFEEAYLTAEDPDNSLNPKNHEMGQATQKTFQQQVNNLCDVIKCMGNPFLDDFPELVTLHSRDCVDPEVAESFRGLESTGNVQYQAFIKDVVTARTKPIHDTIKKNNLSLFKRSGKKKPTNQGKKIKMLANNVALFAQLYVAMQSRDGDLDEFFSHEVQAFPPSLSDLGNLYLPGTKSELLKCLVKEEHSVPPMRFQSRVLDGAVIVHSLPTSAASTFDEYADLVFIPYVLSQLQHSPRVDIVWDAYPPDSLKESTREKRGLGVRRKVAGKTKLPPNWSQFLRDPANKTELFWFLSSKVAGINVPAGKALHITSGKCGHSCRVAPGVLF